MTPNHAFGPSPVSGWLRHHIRKKKKKKRKKERKKEKEKKRQKVKRNCKHFLGLLIIKRMDMNPTFIPFSWA